MAGTVNKNDLDAQGAKDGDIKENIGKILRTRNFTIHRNHENALFKKRHILQNFTKVRDVHCGSNKLN